MIYGRDERGAFRLVADADGDLWEPDWPAVMLIWETARAHAAWRAERDGVGWRLPSELEWEKAARGVDGRRHPWGHDFDPSYCNMRESRSGRGLIAAIDAFPRDESVYGVRGLAGNAQDWCLEAWDKDRVVTGPIADLEVDPPHVARRACRGGSWVAGPGAVRLGYRIGTVPTHRSPDLGFRLVRPL